LAIALAVAGVWLFGSTSIASAAEMTAEDLRTITQDTTGPGLLGDGYLACGGGRGGWGFKGGEIDYQQLLADALGISVEELETAHETARTAAIEQAVEEGLITREQADEMLVWDGMGHKRFGFFGRKPHDVSSDTIDENALLADALGISVEELQTARDEANQAAIAQAIEEGLITQEQADEMQARKDLQSYLDRNSLLASVLDMTVEELEDAYADGKTLSDLLSESGLDAATVREKLQEAYANALAQAVEDGVITQEQADEMQVRPGFGVRGGFGGPGGHPHGDMGKFGGPGGRGGFRGRPGQPGTDADTDDTSGARFRRPGRTLEGDSTL
jgi:formaldehyde-activating enzyme involved in methanogenesis